MTPFFVSVASPEEPCGPHAALWLCDGLAPHSDRAEVPMVYLRRFRSEPGQATEAGYALAEQAGFKAREVRMVEPVRGGGRGL